MPDGNAQEPQAQPQDVTTSSPGAAPGAADPAVDWQAKATEWETRAKGWQAQFNKLQQEQANWNETKTQLESQIAELGTVVTEKDSLEQQLAEMTGEMETHTQTLAQAQAELRKMNLIRDEFPDMLRYETVIPTHEDESEMRDALSRMQTLWQEDISDRVELGVQRATRDIIPPTNPPRGGGQPTLEEVATRLNAVLGDPSKTAEKEALMKQYMELTKE